MSKGVIIYAFKKSAYGKLAWNLAVSIKFHSPGIPVAVIHDGQPFAHLQEWQMKFFDYQILMDKSDLYEGLKFSPGKGKLSGYKYFPFDENIIIDADSICINDVNILFDKCTKDFHAQTVGVWDQDAVDWTCQWMRLNFVKETFALPEKYNIYEINSSFMYVKKGPVCEALYKQAIENYHTGLSHPKLRPWGGGFPDELAWDVAFAQCGIHPQFDYQKELSNDNQEPIYFSTNFTNDWGYVMNKYAFIGYFGDRHFTDSSLQKQYDRLMTAYGNHFGFTHWFKMHQLMKEKHVLTK